MAVKIPLVIGTVTPIQQMEATDVAPVSNGSTGKTLADLVGNTTKVLAVNATENGFDLVDNGSGGGVTDSQAIAYAIALG